MTRTVKIGGSLFVGVFVLALLTLRLVGFEPQYLDPSGEEFANNNRIARPGFWLTGEVAREVVTNWDFVNNLDDPERRDTVMLETRTWYGIPHSVTIGIVGRGEKLYIHAHSDENRMQTPFPNDKLWTRNVSRDPRVRLKIGDTIYEATVALMTDRDEVAVVMGRDPVRVERGPDGREHVMSVMPLLARVPAERPRLLGRFTGRCLLTSMGPDGAVIADQRREAHTKSSSLRENERGMHIPAVWNRHWHKPTDLYRRTPTTNSGWD